MSVSGTEQEPNPWKKRGSAPTPARPHCPLPVEGGAGRPPARGAPGRTHRRALVSPGLGAQALACPPTGSGGRFRGWLTVPTVSGLGCEAGLLIPSVFFLSTLRALLSLCISGSQSMTPRPAPSAPPARNARSQVPAQSNASEPRGGPASVSAALPGVLMKFESHGFNLCFDSLCLNLNISLEWNFISLSSSWWGWGWKKVALDTPVPQYCHVVHYVTSQP